MNAPPAAAPSTVSHPTPHPPRKKPNLHDSADPRADLTGDGLVDFSDYLEFLNLYDSGC